MVPIAPPLQQMPSDGYGVGAYLGATLLTGLMLLAALWLKKRRPAREGAESAAYELARLTIEDQRAQMTAMRSEIDTLRKTRSEIEGALLISEANVKIAQQAAATAAGAAEANYRELIVVREKLQKAEAYIHTLRTTLARHGYDIPDRAEHVAI